jgi:glycosyltransferase involved in cell wall biosynthesis
VSRSVAWVTMASTHPMGQQHHESSLQRALRRRARDGWVFSARRVVSLRSRDRDGVRLPLRALAAAPRLATGAVGQVAYGRVRLVHRFDLRLPPRLGREVVTVHDLPPLRFDDEGRLSPRTLASARRAVGVICPSQFAAEEIRALLRPRRVWVVPNGVSEEIGRALPLTSAELAARGITERFVLHAGGATRRKNLDALATAWKRVAARCPDTTLVLCGPPHPRRERLFGAVPQARYLGHLDPASVARLMRSAAAVVVPSVYEGFGLPALEGMAAGVPVVAAARGALPEVCGGAALLVPATAEGVADGLVEALTDGTLASALRERGPGQAAAFSWSSAAEATLAIYEEALA